MKRVVLFALFVAPLVQPGQPAAQRLGSPPVAQIVSPAEPRLVNAKLERQRAADIDAEVRRVARAIQDPTWIAYRVPLVAGDHGTCCGVHSQGGLTETCCTACALEPADRPAAATSPSPAAPIPLESRFFWVFLRAAGGKVQRLRTFTDDCTIDAGQMRVLSYGTVDAAQSLRLLMHLIHADLSEASPARPQQAVGAIALHAATTADEALERLARGASETMAVRKQAVVWLGSARRAPGFAVLRAMSIEERSPELRKHVAFALSVSPEPPALDILISMARSDPDAGVRGQALFWLAYKAGRQAESAITDAIRHDPDTEVKKRAVFAISQLPKDRGVPLLIDVARTHQNPAVRKQAMFWLGQSKDPRALAFFEEILTRR